MSPYTAFHGINVTLSIQTIYILGKCPCGPKCSCAIGIYTKHYGMHKYCKSRCLQEQREVYKLSTQKAKMFQTKRGKWPRTSPHRWPSLYKISLSTSENLNRLTSRVSFSGRYMYMYHPVHVHVQLRILPLPPSLSLPSLSLHFPLPIYIQ